MATWIALLRGVNVGGHNVIAMKSLRALLDGLGLSDVRSYIQSGNCVFDSVEQDAAVLRDSIANAIEAQFKFRPQVFVLAQRDLATAIHNNPFPQAQTTPQLLHFYFLSDPTAAVDLAELHRVKTQSEQFCVVGQVFYLFTPDGFRNSKVAGKVDRCIGAPVTARNLRTVLKIAELAQ